MAPYSPDLISSAASDMLDAAIDRAARALAAMQRPDGHWVFELEDYVKTSAEYLLLRQYLGEPDDLVLEERIGRYLRRIQSGVHGGWGLFPDGGFDVSSTVKAYFALKMIGDDPAAPHMARARTAILAAGGAEAVDVFTRIQLALFGAGSWDGVPTMPPELMLAPRWFPVHLSKMSFWARTVIVPLLVLCVKKPVAKNPRGVLVPELFTGRPAPLASKGADLKRAWGAAFGLLDRMLKAGDGWWPGRTRARAIDACVAWVTERLNGEDGLGAIYPAMANSVMMFDCLGYAEECKLAWRSVELLLVHAQGASEN